MSEISILDLQNLRHLIGGFETSQCKMQDYASEAKDPEIRKLFQDAADSAMTVSYTHLDVYKRQHL